MGTIDINDDFLALLLSFKPTYTNLPFLCPAERLRLVVLAWRLFSNFGNLDLVHKVWSR